MRTTRKCIWFQNKQELVDFFHSFVNESINGFELKDFSVDTRRSRRIDLRLYFMIEHYKLRNFFTLITAARYLGPAGYALSLDRTYDIHRMFRVNSHPVQIRDFAQIWYNQKTKKSQVTWLFGLQRPKSSLYRLANHPYFSLPVIFRTIFSFL